MKQTNSFFLLSLAIIVGLGGAAATALAQGDTVVTLCYRNRTIKVPSYLVTRYVAKGATTLPANGTCATTGA